MAVGINCGEFPLLAGRCTLGSMCADAEQVYWLRSIWLGILCRGKSVGENLGERIWGRESGDYQQFIHMMGG